ncbi:MAG: tetraacyldisaccharide 4'-kinase, partial [Gammaproteobacteria bacterium]
MGAPPRRARSPRALLEERLLRLWYGPRGPAERALGLALLPAEGLFRAAAALRRGAYRRRWLEARRLPVPVVVVGNLAAGGSGKTPLAAALAQALRARGRRPGLVARGYGGRAAGPRLVGPEDDPAVVGDEPVLLARITGCPVAVGRDRPAAA